MTPPNKTVVIFNLYAQDVESLLGHRPGTMSNGTFSGEVPELPGDEIVKSNCTMCRLTLG